MYEALTCQLAKRLIPNLSIEINSNLKILRDLSQSQEFRLEVHTSLQEDAVLDRLVNDLFSHVEDSDMRD